MRVVLKKIPDSKNPRLKIFKFFFLLFNFLALKIQVSYWLVFEFNVKTTVSIL